MNTTKNTIVVEQSFKASVSEVWKAISEIDQMRQWFFENIESFKAEVGFETQFNVKSEERNFLHLWKLTEVIPLKKIVYLWKYEGYDGESYVSFELFEENNQTRLRVSHTGIDSFPKAIPEFSSESCRQGWQYFINNRLRTFIEEKTL